MNGDTFFIIVSFLKGGGLLKKEFSPLRQCSLRFFALRLGLISFNPVALRKAKIVCNFGLSECNRVKKMTEKNIWKCIHKPYYIIFTSFG